jgi:hypothetical protein
MFGIGFEGTQGKYSVPLESALGLYKQVAIINPGGFTQPMFVTTNGKLDIQCDDPDTLLIAKARMATLWKFDDKDIPFVLKEFIEPICKLIDKLILDKMEFGNDDVTFKKQEAGGSTADVMLETVNRTPEDRPIFFRDRRRIIIAFDRLWKATKEDEIQWEIQNLLGRVRNVPNMAPIGYGFMHGESGKDWHLERRPNKYIKVGPRTVIKMDQTTLDIGNNEARIQASYMYLAAYALREFCKIGNAPNSFNKKEYNLHDYVAYCNLILAGIAGFGDTPTTKHWSSLDIQTTIDHMVGYGYTVANRYQWGSDGDPAIWKHYYRWCLIMAFAIARVKAPTMDYEFVKFINQDRLVHDRLTQVNGAHFPGFGGFGNLTLLMPRNDMKWKGKNMFAFPVIVDVDPIDDEKTILREANDYQRLRTKQISFSTVRIEKGEIPPNTVDHLSLMQKWIILEPTNDARIIEMALEMRDTIEYSFDRSSVVSNGIDEHTRQILYLISNLTNSSRVLTDGYITDVSLSLFRPYEVTYFKTSFEEMAVSKKDTATVTDAKAKVIQVPKDAAGMAGPAIANKEPKPQRTDIRPPPSMERVPEKKHLEETPTGEVTNVSEETVKSEGEE